MPDHISEAWAGTSWIVEVTATDNRDGKPFQATHLTPGRFWAQIGPFSDILAPKTAAILCAAVDLDLFRKP